MDPIILICVALQCLIVGYLIYRLRGRALDKLGVLLMATTLAFHGLTEVIQGLFADRNDYRYNVTSSSLEIWVGLITAAMFLFVAVYLRRLRVFPQKGRLQSLLHSISGSYFLKWPVLLAFGLGGMSMLMIHQGAAQTETSYWSGGLADQFTTILLGLSMATICITVARRKVFIIFIAYALLMAAYGSRDQVLTMTFIALATLARYGLRLQGRVIVGMCLVLVAAFSVISIARNAYGRFTQEDFSQRISVLAGSVDGSVQPATAKAGQSDGRLEAILNDTVYRFDGNSFGAMVVERQLEGYGATGLTQALNTAMYIIPSFIYRDKLDSDVYMRNEEAYQDYFYGLQEDVDYVTDFWNLLIGYVGIYGFLVAAPVLGLIVAGLDNWLAQSTTMVAYLSGITISVIPLTIELGVAGIPYTLRGLLLLLIVAKSLDFARKSARPARIVRGRVRESYSLDRSAGLATSGASGD